MTQATEKLTAVVTMLSDLDAAAVCLLMRAAHDTSDVEAADEGLTGDLRGVPAPCASDILAQRGYRILERHGAVEKDYDGIPYLELVDIIEDARRDARKKPTAA